MSDRMPLTVATRTAGLALTLAAITGLGWAGCNRNGSAVDTVSNAEAGSPNPDERIERYEIDLFAFGRQLGTIAPCGCTTEPLGGLQYAFGYIEAQSLAGSRLILEPGSFLFPDPDGPEAPTDEAAWAQAKQRAELLAKRFGAIDGLVSGLGPTDYASPSSKAAVTELPLPRAIANVEDAARPPGVTSHREVSLGHGLTAAVTQIVDPQLVEAARARGWGADFPAVTEPIAALEQLWPKLESASLQIVMVNGPRSLAETVARELEGVDVVVIGGVFTNADQSRLGGAPVQIGKVWVLEPGDRAQTISHLTLSLHPNQVSGTPGEPNEAQGSLSSPWTLIPSKAQRQAELARLDEKLAKFANDPTADQGFIARLEAQREELAAMVEQAGIPDDVQVAVLAEQIKVTCHLPADATAKAALDGYDGVVAEVNRKRFTGVHAPAPAPGQPGYVGIEACVDCHQEAVAQWKTTVHQRAYDTLEATNKQFDLSCVSCHVTGFRQPGGSEVVENQRLQDVQCEQCHGPGSLHVEDPSTTNIRLQAPITACLTCHTPEHSDTFDYQAYLLDVLGEGHGAQARAKLPAGPTGRELRAAGLARAGGGCKK
jgi:hypothetical protein